MKGRTKWFKRMEPPVRAGFYEVGYIITSSQRHAFLGTMFWDGLGFITDMPLIRVVCWRGMTKKAHHEALKSTNEGV